MKRILLAFSILLVSSYTGLAQTQAANWTATDCNATSHTLFTELDNGKVIVLVWVMPCPACVSGGKTAYNIVQNYATTYPGRVAYYLVDDMGDDSCLALTNWASANSIDPAKITMFSNGGNSINQNNYGGSGMPHLVVLGGGAGHKVYLNTVNTDVDNASAIQNAINWAMIPASIYNIDQPARINIYPNPATDRLSVQYAVQTRGTVSFDIVNVIGKKLNTVTKTVNAGNYKEDINVNNLPNGVYFIKFSNNNASQSMKFTVNR